MNSSRLYKATSTGWTRPGAPVVEPEVPQILSGADWLWEPIPASPVIDASSANYITSVSSQGKLRLATYAFGVPVYVIPPDGTAPTVSVNVTVFGIRTATMRIPNAAAPSPGTDGAMVIIDYPLGKQYGFWQAVKSGGQWSASGAEIYDLDSDGRIAIDGAGVTGWGMSRMAGVALRSEIEAAWPNGHIPHALVYAGRASAPTVFRYPARKTDGSNIGGTANPIPEGSRIQMNPAFNVETADMTTIEKIICRTMQIYGMYVIDNAGGQVVILQGNDPTLATPPSNPGDPTATGGWAQDYGIAWDYFGDSIPWEQCRVLASWDGS